jgi:signal transduction histidine kinase
MNPELMREVAAMEVGAHLCLFYEDDRGEQVPAIVPYIGEGLEAGEQCTYVGDRAGIQELREGLDTHGVDYAAHAGTGLLQLWTPEDWHQRVARGGEAGAIARTLSDEARSNGFAGVRLAVDVADLLGAERPPERIRAWEGAVEPPNAETAIRTICLYSRSRMPADGLRVALYTHRAVIIGTSVCANQYFESPAMHAGASDPERARVDAMLAQLRWAHAAEREHIGRLRAQAALADVEAAQQRIEALYTDSRRAARTREEFLASASHELKTPVTVFKGYAMLMMRQLERGTLRVDDLAPMIDHLREYADRLERLVGDLVDSSRIQSGQLELQLESVELAGLVTDVIERLAREGYPEPTSRIELDAPNPVGGRWDRVRLEQVVTTLLKTAVRSSPNSGGIVVSVSASGQSAELGVRSAGSELDAPEQSRALFEPSRHASNAPAATEGPGLGLYVASHIARQHGGTIEVDSSPDGGSVFTLRLPRQLAGDEVATVQPGFESLNSPAADSDDAPERPRDVATEPTEHRRSRTRRPKGRRSR